MSRCFPFPPPGYESTARGDQVDLLAKEKHKEKKQKKEKKDKEKREGKEKKDKDRSKDKHKEKKDRKEKQKDRKKDKNRDKGNDEGRASEEIGTEKRIDGHHEAKPGDSSQGADKDSKFTEELGRRIRDEEKGATNSMDENFTWSIRSRTEGMGAAAAMEKRRFTATGMVPNSTSERTNDEMGQPEDLCAGSVQNIMGMGSSGTAMEKGRGTRKNVVTIPNGTDKRSNYGVGCTVDKPFDSVQERSKGTCIAPAEKERGANKISNTIGTMVPNFIGTEQKKNHGMVRPVDITIPRRVEGICIATVPEKGGKNKNMVSYPIGPVQERNNGIGRPPENLIPSVLPGTEKNGGKDSQMAANLISMEERRHDRIEGSVAKDTDKSMEGKKTRDRKTDDFKGETHRDRDRNEKKNKEKDKDRRKEKKKEKKEKKKKKREKDEHTYKKEADEVRCIKKDMLDSLIIKPLAAHKDNANSSVADKNINKRNDFKLNGFLHENDARPNKIPRTSISISPGAMNNITARVPDNKEHKNNGIIESRPSPVDSRYSVAVDTSEDKISLKRLRPNSNMNGFFHENDERPNKIPRTSISSIPPMENGRTLEPRQIARVSISPRAMNGMITRVPENKEKKINGITESQPSLVNLRSPVAVDTWEDKVPLKPPHPYSKMNGFLQENHAQPSKVPRASISSNLPLENGRTSEPRQIARLSISPRAMNGIISRVPENQEKKINGITESQPSLVDLRSPVPVDTWEDKVPLKPPHPDSKMNGFLHENHAQPSKVPRANISSNLPLENERTSEPRQIALLSISPKAKNKIIARVPETKEHKINGVTESRPPSGDLIPPVEDKVQLKPPHRDSKYLSQIYSVPKMEEWPEFDDQEWLFCSDDIRPKHKAKFEAEETPQVWSEAVQIESIDVTALPYVIPF